MGEAYTSSTGEKEKVSDDLKRFPPSGNPILVRIYSNWNQPEEL